MTINLDSLRTQMEMLNHIAKRDTPKRFAAVHFMILMIWLAGDTRSAVILLGLLYPFEFAAFYLISRMPKTDQISASRIAIDLFATAVISALYYTPGVILVMQPEPALVAGGVIWIVGLLYSTMLMFNTLRAFFLASSIAGYSAAAFATVELLQRATREGDSGFWVVPAGLIALTIVNALQMFRENRDTHHELEHTRAKLLSSHRQLEHMSLHDALTGLQNRAAFGDVLRRMLSRSSATNMTAVFMIDLNGFKPINDTYGHDAGDAVLVAVAERLSAVLRPEAAAFRLGGDEFCVLCHAETREELQTLGDRLIREIRVPIPFKDETLLLGAAIGVGIAQSPDMTETKICANADQAMYQAKTSKLKTALLHDPSLDTPKLTTEDRKLLENALRDHQIRPHYQPVYASDGSRLVGLEALARWHHPSGRILKPNQFLDDLSEVGLLPNLTRSILRQVLEDIDIWRDCGADPPVVSVNIAAVALVTESGRDELDWLIAEHPGSERRVAFEITEDIYVMRSADMLAAHLNHFRTRGVAIYLDDFGSGHASYQHLRKLTPDLIKLDGPLVAGLGAPGQSDAIISAFIGMAHGLEARVLAEHVETEPQRAWLATNGCDYVQGRLFSDAVTSDAVPSLCAPTAPSSHHPPKLSSR